MRKFYISLYHMSLMDGGPEEGGWHYDWYEYVKSYKMVRCQYQQEAPITLYHCDTCDCDFEKEDLVDEFHCPACSDRTKSVQISPRAWPVADDKLRRLLERSEKIFNRCFRHGYYSVLGGEMYVLKIESSPGQYTTKERPHYC